MSRITKELAENISMFLVKKKREELALVVDKLNLSLIDLYKSRYTPKEVIDFDQKFPGYVRKKSSFYLNGNGFRHDYIDLGGNSFIVNPEIGTILEPTPQEAKDIQKKQRSISVERKQINDLQSSIYNALLSLKTFKAVRENFPEAAELLPAESNPSLLPSLNLSSIREQLK